MHRVETTYNNELQPKADKLRLVNYLAVPPPPGAGRQGHCPPGGTYQVGSGYCPCPQALAHPTRVEVVLSLSNVFNANL